MFRLKKKVAMLFNQIAKLPGSDLLDCCLSEVWYRSRSAHEKILHVINHTMLVEWYIDII